MAEIFDFLIMTGLFVFPGVVGVLACLYYRRESFRWLTRWTIIVVVLILVCQLILYDETRNIFINDFLNFTFTKSGMIAGLVTVLFGGLVFLFGLEKKKMSPQRWVIGTSIVSLGFSNLAFFASNFLLRYIALELLGLSVSLIVLFKNFTWIEFKKARTVFLYLKLGDLGMLIGILLLRIQTGTLKIDKALSVSGDIPPPVMAWIICGFILAVLVKMGVWPFYAWMRLGEGSEKGGVTWLFTILMPSLGMYLLYRVTPLIAVDPLLKNLVFWLGIILFLVVILEEFLREKFLEKTPLVLGSLLGALALVLVSSGKSEVVLWSLIIVTILRSCLELLPERNFWNNRVVFLLSVLGGFVYLIIFLSVRNNYSLEQLGMVFILILLMIIWANYKKPSMPGVKELGLVPEDFQRSRKVESIVVGIYDKMGPRFFQNGLEVIARGAIKGFEGIYWFIEIGILDFLTRWGKIITQTVYQVLENREINEMGAMDFLMRWGNNFNRAVYQVLENRGINEMGTMDFLMRWGNSFTLAVFQVFEKWGFIEGENYLVRTFLQGSKGLNKLEKRDFRRNLLWIPLMLFMIILFLVISPGFG